MCDIWVWFYLWMLIGPILAAIIGLSLKDSPSDFMVGVMLFVCGPSIWIGVLMLVIGMHIKSP